MNGCRPCPWAMGGWGPWCLAASRRSASSSTRTASLAALRAAAAQGPRALPKIRQLIFAGQYAEAQKLADETFIPARQGRWPPAAGRADAPLPGLENAAATRAAWTWPRPWRARASQPKTSAAPAPGRARSCLCRGRRDRGAPGQHAAQAPHVVLQLSAPHQQQVLIEGGNTPRRLGPQPRPR